MKRFTQFFTEARETSASAEAKRLGLTGDGHGGWYDKNGEFVAKTVSGKLKFFGQGKKSKEVKGNVEDLINDLLNTEEDDCDSCKV